MANTIGEYWKRGQILREMVNNQPILQKVDPVILEELESIFTEKIIPFLINFYVYELNPFYGIFLTSCTPKVDFSVRAETDIDISGNDIHITMNPLIALKHDFKKFATIVICELFRLIHFHPAVYYEKNEDGDDVQHEFMEVSSTLAVSEMIISDITEKNSDPSYKMLGLPDEFLTLEKFHAQSNIKLDVSKGNSESKEITKVKEALKNVKISEIENKFYDDHNTNYGSFLDERELKKFQKELQKFIDDGGNPDDLKDMPATEKNFMGKNSHMWEKILKKNEQDANSGTKEIDSSGDGTTIKKVGGMSLKELKDSIESKIQISYSLTPEKDRGLLPGGITNVIEAITAPPLRDWAKEARSALKNMSNKKLYTWSRLNRRQPDIMMIPGKIRKPKYNIAVIIDTSGSVDDEMLQFVISELLNMAKSGEFTITVILCDVQVQDVYEIKTVGDVKKLPMKGRGGTAFTPAIEYINKNPRRFKTALTLYFTDGYGDESIPKPNVFRFKWVLVEESAKTVSASPTYGPVLNMWGNKKWAKFQKNKNKGRS